MCCFMGGGGFPAAAAFVTVVMRWIADTYAPFGIWNILLPLGYSLFFRCSRS